MLNAITTGFDTILTMVGDLLKSIVDTQNGELSSLLPIIGVAIAMGIVGFGVKTIKSLVWGF